MKVCNDCSKIIRNEFNSGLFNNSNLIIDKCEQCGRTKLCADMIRIDQKENTMLKNVRVDIYITHWLHGSREWRDVSGVTFKDGYIGFPISSFENVIINFSELLHLRIDAK